MNRERRATCARRVTCARRGRRAPGDVRAPGEERAPGRVRAPKVRDARRENRNVGDVRSVKTEVDNQRLSDARLIHGAIMVVAWLFLSPWASLLARCIAISILGGFERIETRSAWRSR